MKALDKIKGFGKAFCGYAVSAYYDFSTALNDCARISEADNKILSLSSGGFCRAFGYVARKISEARPNKTADTYCMLVDKACEMLASGKSEAETLYYFDKMLENEFAKSEN